MSFLKASSKPILSFPVTIMASVFLFFSLAGCTSTSPPQPTISPPPTISSADGASAAVLRMGYRWAKAGAGDQFVIPPERFMILGVDGVALGPDGRMLTLSAGSHSFEVAATGGPFRGTGEIKARLHSGADYQLTGFLDSRGKPAFILWLEDTLTHQPASPRQRLELSRSSALN
jgi:hypothetical protein